MFKKLGFVVITTFALVVHSNAGSDNELLLKKNEPSNIKDCFEKINRATFAFNSCTPNFDGMPGIGVFQSRD